MTVANAWLPPGARLPVAAMAALDLLVDAWAAAWFGTRRMRVLGTFERSRDGALRGDGWQAWHAVDAGLEVAVSGDGLAAIGRQALDLSGADELHDADRRVIDRVARDCVHDLATRLHGWLDVAHDPVLAVAMPNGRDHPHRIELRDDAASIAITVGLSGARFVARVKQASPDTCRQPLSSFGDAIAASNVRLAAEIGTCMVTLDEMRDLVLGDVLVFDRPLDAALPLVVGRGTIHAATCTVMRHADRIALQIVNPPAG